MNYFSFVANAYFYLLCPWLVFVSLGDLLIHLLGGKTNGDMTFKALAALVNLVIFVLAAWSRRKKGKSNFVLFMYWGVWGIICLFLLPSVLPKNHPFGTVMTVAAIVGVGVWAAALLHRIGKKEKLPGECPGCGLKNSWKRRFNADEKKWVCECGRCGYTTEYAMSRYRPQ